MYCYIVYTVTQTNHLNYPTYVSWCLVRKRNRTYCFVSLWYINISHIPINPFPPLAPSPSHFLLGGLSLHKTSLPGRWHRCTPHPSQQKCFLLHFLTAGVEWLINCTQFYPSWQAVNVGLVSNTTVPMLLDYILVNRQHQSYRSCVWIDSDEGKEWLNKSWCGSFQT